MTEVTRVLDVERNRFLNVERKYVGQQFDSLTTTLHFEYDPVDFLSTEHDGKHYTPYIIFDVRDDDGDPMIYGSASTPKFDGYTFSLPWDITSRAMTQRITYQLYFVSDDYYVYDEEQRKYVESGEGTKYMLSPKDGIAIKPSIGGEKRRKCCPTTMAPSTEPSIVGYINMWKEKGLIGPVKTILDPETGIYTLTFQTFSGEIYDVEMTIDTSVLEYKLDSKGHTPHTVLVVDSEGAVVDMGPGEEGQTLRILDGVPQWVSAGAGAVLTEDLTVTRAVGGIAKGTVYPEGTLLEDIFRDMLTKTEETMRCGYGASTDEPVSDDGFTMADVETSELISGWNVTIRYGTIEEEEAVTQYPVVSVPSSLTLNKWIDTGTGFDLTTTVLSNNIGDRILYYLNTKGYYPNGIQYTISFTEV